MALLFRPMLSSTPISISFSKSVKMANQSVSFASSSSSSDSNSSSSSSSISVEKTRKLPILLFDIMDTVVRDPFYQDIPAFFRMTLKELIECKHPLAWVDFEKGLINETELARIFFKDGRALDLEGLKECIKNGYSYIDGVEALLCNLKQHNYEMHAFTNYPNWYTMIEDKLKVSTYMSWTFCSCKSGKRKPEADSYLDVLRHLGVEPASCIFIDDRMVNVEAARNAGIVALQFKDAASLQRDLSQLGVETSCSSKDVTANKNHQDLTASMREQLS